MKIEWTEPAIADMEGIRDYIAKDSEYYAARFIGKIIQSVGELVYSPKIGRTVPEADHEDIRELLFHSYRILYRVEKDWILILAVIHGSRNLGGMEPKPWDIV